MLSELCHLVDELFEVSESGIRCSDHGLGAAFEFGDVWNEVWSIGRSREDGVIGFRLRFGMGMLEVCFSLMEKL